MSLVSPNFKELSNPLSSHTSHSTESWSYQYSMAITSKFVKQEGVKDGKEIVIHGPQRMGQNFSNQMVIMMNEVTNLELILSN